MPMDNRNNMLPDEALLAAAEAGDVKALVALDSMGFIMGKEETPSDFVKRLRVLNDNINGMEETLAASGKYEKDDAVVYSRDRIPKPVFAEAAAKDREIFGFSIDWVPGFFIDPFFLFGGCAYYYFPDFFAMFIIRRSFRKNKKWFIYKREELLAHELCHIARIALGSELFEETFAYQTSDSSFRKLLGGIFLRPLDSYLFLGATFALLGAQIARTYFFPSLPICWFWLLPILVVSWLGIRYMRLMHVLAKARKNMAVIWGKAAELALFRSSDDEIWLWSKFQNDADARTWLEKQSIRWKVIDAVCRR